MEIQDIKNRLNITDVASHLGIKIDRNQRALCPFHADKNPSLQFSKEKQIATCFSSNCNLGTVDIIGLTEKSKNINTHEAIMYLKENFNLSAEAKTTINNTKEKEIHNYNEDFGVMQSSFLNSTIARKYTESRNLNYKTLEVGYNAFKSSKFNYLRGCITFGLKDKQGKIVSMYGRSVRDNDKAKHYYTANRKGLYPAWPKPETTKLIITESIIDCATLQNISEIAENYSLLSAYGTNGITGEHHQAIQELKELEEIVFFFDGDESGYEAIEKYLISFYKEYPKLTLSFVSTPDNEDINSLTEGHSKDVFIHLLKERIKLTQNGTPNYELMEELPFSFSIEEKEPQQQVSTAKHLPHRTGVAKCPTEAETAEAKVAPKPITVGGGNFLDTETTKRSQNSVAKNLNSKPETKYSSLNTSNSYKISYATKTATYYIKGGLPKALDSLKITLEIEHPETGRKSRNKPDLYEDKQVEKVSREAGEKLVIRADLIEMDLNYLTDLLDEYRESQLSLSNEELTTKKPQLSVEQQTKCVNFLKQKDLIKKFNKQIEKAGITGEENNRIFLFVIATSYKMPDTLHALIQGSSGSGKTYLSRQITDLMPKEDVIRLTRVTESSFYNYGEYELQYKLIVLEDVEGLKEEAEYAFRELQSNKEIISSTSAKDENSGQIKAQIRRVCGPIGSIATTTKGEIYEDNMSRIFLLAVDESRSQTDLIIKYQNKKAAGMINKSEEYKIRDFVQNCVRMLKPYEVVNPYANKILLPPEAHKIRRLTELYHAFINQVTLINQYQRTKDQYGRLITEKEDVQTAIDIMFESIVLKIDELDGSLRQFYEALKAYIMKQDKEYKNYNFTQREIRQALLISKSQLQRYINDLLELEYIAQSSGNLNRGYTYKITYWDNLQAMRDKIKSYLNSQLEQL